MIAISNQVIFGTRQPTGWLTGEYDGTSVKLDVPLEEGKPYLSIQPDGKYEGRESGGGAYESFTKIGSDLVCRYRFEGVEVVHVCPFKDFGDVGRGGQR